ncbi:MAG: MopE-related protein [Pseudomonadota bacterium]
MRLHLLIALALLTGCPPKPEDTSAPEGRDADGDGYGSEVDCDDADPAVHPGAVESCNGTDDDCDGFLDDDDPDVAGDLTLHRDADGDGWGSLDPVDARAFCTAPSGGWVADPTDCDDEDPSVHPGAQELCNGEDDDCDGEIDEDAALESTLDRDDDGDGFGQDADTIVQCDQPSGYVLDPGDCDDAEPAVNPSAHEHCDGVDEDCDGAVDEDALDAGAWYPDADADGWGDDAGLVITCTPSSGAVDRGGDCDDTRAGVNPDADEHCDGVDEDCDGVADDGAVDAPTWYADGDADGYGDSGSPATACADPSGHVAEPGDCDDADAAVHPGADEHCDGVDEDCDGGVDEEPVDPDTFYADADGDGYGDAGVAMEACTQPSDHVADDTDCDDTRDTVYPGAPERCDGLDDDCDGVIDAGAVDAPTWYADADGDGHGDPGSGLAACTQPSDHVAYDTDCDDTRDDVHPGADEHCDGADEDCDGTVDNDAVDAVAWHTDADADGYGTALSIATACTAPSGTVADGTDCDDGVASVHPGADEHCDGVDEDCDGDTDEEPVDADTFYADADADSYGDAGSVTEACTQPSGYVADATDCDDTLDHVYPGAVEHCDGVDEDCDGTVDDRAVDMGAWYADADGDGYGGAGPATRACTQPSGYAASADDCDDTAAAIHPGADEHCDGVDEDCDGDTDEEAVDAGAWYADADGDSFGDPEVVTEACSQPSGTVADDTDCDDSDASVYPGAVEHCDDVDEDCDGDVDEGAVDEEPWYIDADGDGYGDSTGTPEYACDQPSGYAGDDADCDDDDADVNPGAVEICNGVDDDCDGTTDGPGMVTFVSTYGSVADLTSVYASGTATAAYASTMATSGTLTLCPGTYYVELTVQGADVSVIGLDGSGATALVGDGTGSVVTVNAACTDLLVEGLTIEGGTSASQGGGIQGGTHGVDLELVDVVVQDCSALSGGGIYQSNGALTASDLLVQDCTASNYGGGLYVNGVTLALYTAEFDDNIASAQWGGGVYTANSTVAMEDVTVTGNSSGSYAGGAYLGYGTADITSCDFDANSATSAGGLMIQGGSAAITSTGISDNVVSYIGGGLYVTGATVSIVSTQIDGNTAGTSSSTRGYGGGVLLNNSATLACYGSTSTTAGVYDNTSLWGGGVLINDASSTLTSSVCDWGNGGTDNFPDDVALYAYMTTYRGYHSDEDFTCSGSSCL